YYGDGSQYVVNLARSDTTSAFTWDNNTYYDLNSRAEPDGTRYSFGYFAPGVNPTNRFGGGILTFDEPETSLGKGWKAWTGLDAHTTYTSGVKPSGLKVFVRPNQYEAGRAHIAVYNFDNTSNVSVNLSGIGLGNGDTYEIRDVQNWFGSPVVTGTYN